MDSNELAPDNVSSEDDVDFDYDDFYGNNELCGTVNFEQDDPEYIEYRCLEVSQVKQLLDDTVNRVVFALNISSSLAKLLLCLSKWEEDVLISSYKIDAQKMLRESHVCASSPLTRPESTICKVCARWVRECEEMFAGDCGHSFCSSCWLAYFEAQFSNGLSLMISCMENDCPLLCLEDFVLRILNDHERIRAKYKELIFKDCVVSNSHLRFCPGQDCTITIFSECQKAKKVTCSKCQTSFCFRCGIDYHAPTSCEIIRKWLIKCADDSETANYISAHTKDCPNCHTCIEKNGGCNHMQCARCKHHFCWMCFGDWKTHGSEYYECSRYKENPTVAQEANHVKARRALEKYLHYYERYENHHKSLRIEEELRNCIMRKIEEKVNGHEGTWIDWQYLHNAATLLTKCRYTLQYTYPYAYFMESGPRKQLFEYQQAQLEKEIEELSWKVERAESTERGDLESQMHVAECKRRTLLHDFLD